MPPPIDMRSRPAPVTPDALRLSQALVRSAPLAELQARIRESNERFEIVRPALPAPLVIHLKPGPVDEEGWSLLAANTAVAAKLRQWLPKLEAMLKERGYPATTIRVKVLGR